MSDTAQRRSTFRTLHESGFFVLPNAWDGGSAARLEARGFRAIGSSSAAAAWAAGRKDGELGCDEVLAHLEMLVGSTSLPVNADFENGFSDTPEGVASNVVKAVRTGVAGISIEDWSGSELYDVASAADRLAAARAAIDAVDPATILIGRAEFFRAPDVPTSDWIARAVAYSEAGADCLFVPFMLDHGAVAELVAAVSPKPVNVLVGAFEDIPGFAALGVRRCSVGGGLAAKAWAAFDQATEALRGFE
jgi:2-methylisocitrate lyase-like PEP mutase family enzyme